VHGCECPPFPKRPPRRRTNSPSSATVVNPKAAEQIPNPSALQTEPPSARPRSAANLAGEKPSRARPLEPDWFCDPRKHFLPCESGCPPGPDKAKSDWPPNQHTVPAHPPSAHTAAPNKPPKAGGSSNPPPPAQSEAAPSFLQREQVHPPHRPPVRPEQQLPLYK